MTKKENRKHIHMQLVQIVTATRVSYMWAEFMLSNYGTVDRAVAAILADRAAHPEENDDGR